MSARREHRLRRLERRVDALEDKVIVLDMMQQRTDIRLFEMSRIQAEIRLPEAAAGDVARTPTQARPQKGLLQRIVDFFGWR